MSDPGAGGETGRGPGGVAPDGAGPWAAPDQPAVGWAAPGAGAETGPAPAATPAADPSIDPIGAASSVGVPEPLPPALRPMTAGDAIDGAFALLRARPRAVLGTAALFVVPLQLVSAFVLRNVFDDAGLGQVVGDSSVTFGTNAGTSGTATVVSYLLLVAMGIALTFICATYAKLLAAWYGGQALATGDAIKGALAQAPSQVAAWFLVHLVAVPAACTLVGGIFLTPLYLVLAPAIAVERLNPIEGIQRAWRLGTKRYWGAFLVALLSGLAASLLGQAASAGLTVVALLVPSSIGWILVAVGNSLAAIVGAVAVAGATALFYLEARVRTEGLDLVLASADAFDG